MVRSATPGDGSGDPRFLDLRQNRLISLPSQILRNMVRYAAAAAAVFRARQVRRVVAVRAWSVAHCAARVVRCRARGASPHNNAPRAARYPLDAIPRRRRWELPKRCGLAGGWGQCRCSESGHLRRRSDRPRHGCRVPTVIDYSPRAPRSARFTCCRAHAALWLHGLEPQRGVARSAPTPSHCPNSG